MLKMGAQNGSKMGSQNEPFWLPNGPRAKDYLARRGPGEGSYLGSILSPFLSTWIWTPFSAGCSKWVPNDHFWGPILGPHLATFEDLSPFDLARMGPKMGPKMTTI